MKRSCDMPPPRDILVVAIALVAMGCGLDAEREGAARDDGPDLLYRDFLDGKTDGAGHPIGATVFEGEQDCNQATGWAIADYLDFDPRYDDPGRGCEAETAELGRGPYVANIRAAIRQMCDDVECGAVLEARVIDQADEIVATLAVRAEDFQEEMKYQNFALHFRLRDSQAVRVEVDYTGFGAVMVDYVEVFRQGRQLVLSPPSGVMDPTADLRIEIVDPPDDHALRVRCDDVELDMRLSDMLASGEAIEELTDFRRILTVPTSSILEGCAAETQIVVDLMTSSWVSETSELRYTAEPAACDFRGSGATKVLITGFVPFPAGAQMDNSSMEAVLAFDPAMVPDASVMKMILPVEFLHAPGLVEDAIARCQPDVVVGFGQGRGRVDLERTGYNIRDTSDVMGGIPDNRGLVVEPAPIREGGPDTYESELPIETIEADLVAAGISVGQSDDPGRYVCNDHMYTIGTSAEADRLTTGFIHMPYVRSVDDARRAELATVVESVVRRTVEAHAASR